MQYDIHMYTYVYVCIYMYSCNISLYACIYISRHLSMRRYFAFGANLSPTALSARLGRAPGPSQPAALQDSPSGPDKIPL